MKHGYNSIQLTAAAAELRRLAAVTQTEIDGIACWSAEAPRLEQQILSRQFEVAPDDFAGIASLASDRNRLAHMRLWVVGAERRTHEARGCIEGICRQLYDLVWDGCDKGDRQEVDIVVLRLADRTSNFLVLSQGRDRDIAGHALQTADWLDRFVADVKPEWPTPPPGQRYLSSEELLIRRRDQLTRK